MVRFFSVPFWWYHEVNLYTTVRRILTATFEQGGDVPFSLLVYRA